MPQPFKKTKLLLKCDLIRYSTKNYLKNTLDDDNMLCPETNMQQQKNHILLIAGNWPLLCEDVVDRYVVMAEVM